MSLEKCAELTDGLELKLDIADKAAIVDDTRYSHEEIFGKIRSFVNYAE